MNNTKPVEKPPSCGVDSSQHWCAEVAYPTKQSNTFTDTKTAIVRPNIMRLDQMSAVLSLSSSSSQQNVEDRDIKGRKHVNPILR